MLLSFSNRKHFSELTEAEILALAIASEEDDAMIYENFAKCARRDYPASADVFMAMAAEEHEHRRILTDDFKRRFGDIIPLIRREHVAGFYARRPIWLLENLGIERMRQEVAQMEEGAYRFYMQAAKKSTDTATRKLLSDLAEHEQKHIHAASNIEKTHMTPDDKQAEKEQAHRQFVLTWVQPGLAGLMDGSVSTLAPIFATAFATQDPHTTFIVGLAASIGAGISMGFTEAAHDDGVISGRGSPVKRGLASGIMTMLGGLGHAVPYLIPHFWTATSIAFVIVFIELWAIAWIQNRYMETPFLRAAFQVVLGGGLVLAAGILIGGG